MNEKTYIDMLTEDSVSLRKQQFTMINGVNYPIGEPWRRAYVNSEKGRQQIQTEVTEPHKSVIMMMWGNVPTVEEFSQ